MRKLIAKVALPARQKLLLSLFSVVLCGPTVFHAESAGKQIPFPLPPMGWSSWNSFSNTVDSQIIIDQARAMVSNGMAKAGYEYVNIDEGWWLGERDAKGSIVVDPKAWPALTPNEQAGDMANIVHFIHRLGLKAGIYTDVGRDGCTLNPDLGPVYLGVGSEGHYEQDFLQFAKWGFDYVKVDWCGGDKEKLDPAVQYAEIARAAAKAEAATGHRLYLSICDWGNNSPWTWAPNVGGAPSDIWRTSGDIVAPIVQHHAHSGRLASFSGVLSNFDQGIHPEAQHTGFYNDPDMMVIGMPGLTDEQNRVHMSLWAISGAPLLVGADLKTLTGVTLATLTNPDVLAIDQDSLGLQGLKVASYDDGLEVWSKALSTPGERAVLLFNRTGVAASINVHWSELGLDSSSPAAVRDLWTQKDLGSFNSSYAVTVQPNDAVLVLIRGAEGQFVTYTATEKSDGPEDQGVSFVHVASHTHVARIRITYANPEHAPCYAELRVNGQIATRVAFPATGVGSDPGVVWVQVPLNVTSADNGMTFSRFSSSALTVKAISVEQ